MSDDFKTLAAQLRDLQDAAKAQVQGVLARAEEAGLDPAGLRRFVSWKRKDEAKRAQQEAIDQQCRYLAGERDTPAQLPIGCELAQALNLYRRDFTVRQVAEELRISTGKAGKLRQLSRMFDVHVHATVDKAPSHDPETGEITTAGLDTPPVGSSELSEGHSSAAPDSDATGNSAHEGEGNGHRNDRDGERRGSEELQPERQSGRGRDQGGDGGARHENGKYPRPQQRDGGPRGGGGDHQSPDGQHVVRLGGDEGSLAASRGVDAPSTPPLGAVAEAQPERVARQDDGLDIPPFLRRQRASA